MCCDHQVGNKTNQERLIGSGLNKVIAQLKASASKITDPEKLKTWRRNQKSVDNVLDRLNLNAGVNEAVLNAHLKILEYYVNMLSKKIVSLLGKLLRAKDNRRRLEIPTYPVFEMENKEVRPTSAFDKMFKIDKDIVAAATEHEKSIIAAYRSIYNSTR
ncbi:RxLR effector protein [Phytophthora megakarya]|uniref:RxLR effector protein n=1 Tax=Phytophthora megakarya TaxID=4795 RepID=A0A225X1S5_9STRA|nr:RxLR effector protein [Phytophthora megakarya]